MSFGGDERLHAMMSPTDDPNIFNLDEIDFDVNELFDGSRQIEVSMNASKMNAFHGDSQLDAFNNFLAGFDSAPSKQSDQSTIACSSQQARPNEYSQYNLQSTSTMSAGFDSLGSFSFETYLDEHVLQAHDLLEELTAELGGAQAAVPYAPPAGALSSSNRRVAAEWRNIQ